MNFPRSVRASGGSAEGKRDGIAIQGALAGTITRRDVENQQVRLYPPFTMAGFVDREERRDSKGERKVTGVFLEGTDEVLRAHAFHNQDGSFTIKDVYPGRYRIVPMGFVAGYYVDSVMLGERDVMNQEVDLAPGSPPLRVNYRANAGKVRGSVENCGDSRGLHPAAGRGSSQRPVHPLRRLRFQRPLRN